MELPSFLQYEPGTDFIRLAGHRIGLTHVVRLYAKGNSAELIVANFPSLPLALVYKVLGFYLDNQSEVDAYVAADEAELARQEAEGRLIRRAPTLAELRQRLAVKRAAGHDVAGVATHDPGLPH